jgi:branched-chain amino acid transport system permease protein
VHDAPVLAQFTVTAALLLGLDGLVTLVWDSDQHALSGPFGDSSLTVGPVTTTGQQLGAGLTVLLVMAAVAAFFRFTSIGLRLRAVASNPGSAALLGIRRRRMLTLGWAVAGGIGAITAVMAAPTLSVGADMMTAPLLLAFAAGSLGGFDSRLGAVVGGLLIGLLMALAGRYLPGVGGDLALAVPFAVIWLVLLVRPAGLFGTTTVVRA